MVRLSVLLVLVLGGHEAFAQEAGTLRDLMQARNYAMGGAYRALGLGTEAIGGNPAALSVFNAYRVETTGAWDTTSKDAFASLSVMDSSTSALALGYSYQLVKLGRGEERNTAHLNTLALSYALSPSLLLGGSVRYLIQSGASEANAASPDLGLLLRLGPSLVMGASAHNLINTYHPELSRYYSAHVGFLTGSLNLAGDVRADFPKGEARHLIYGVGAEYLVADSLPLRAGYTYDALTKQDQVGVGLGIVSEGSGLDLAYRQDLGDSKGRLLALTIRIQVN